MNAVDINCYYGDEANVSQRIATRVPVSGGRFSLQFPYLTFEGGHACVLRAVPEGDPEWYPPGDGVPYAGPRITESSEALDSYEGGEVPIRYGYGATATSFQARVTISSAGGCALGGSLLFSPGQLAPSQRTFICDGGLRTPPHERATPTGVTVDGLSAFPPATVYELDHEQPRPSAPQVSVAQTFDPASADISIDAHEPLAICAERPSQPEGCEEWSSAGVELERVWRTIDGNQLALMNDTWRSTDGHQHALAITYELGMGQGPAGGGFQFPGQASFARFPAGLSTAVPTGPATIFYSENLGTPGAGDFVHPFTAISYSGAPSAYSEIEEEFERHFGEMYYSPVLSPGGSFSLQMGFSQAYSLEGAHALAAEAEAAMTQQASPAGLDGIAPPANRSLSPTPPAQGSLKLLDVKNKRGKLVIVVGCAVATCRLKAQLESRERLRRGRIVGVESAHKPLRWRRVTIASVTRSLPAGGRVSMVLIPNGNGRRLLGRFHRLPVLLTLAEAQSTATHIVARKALAIVPNVDSHRRPSPRHGR